VSATQPQPAPSEAEDYCIRRAGVRDERPIDPFAEFCKTRDGDPELEKRMAETLVAGGAELRRFSVRCRADICSVKCVTVPREQCMDDL